MNKNQTTIGVVIAIVLVGLLVWAAKSNNSAAPTTVSDTDNSELFDLSTTTNTTIYSSTGDPIDVKNQTYLIDDRSIELSAGFNQAGAAGNTTTTTKTKLLDGSAFTDIDGDGSKDAVVIIRDETGGSGVFYYSAVVLSNNGSSKVTNSVFLGDRIRVKSISVLSGVIYIDIMDRNATDSFATPATVEKTITLTIKDGVLGQN